MVENYTELDIQGDPPCSFCKRSRETIKYVFVNETRDTFMCDDCVKILSDKLHQLVMLESAAPTGVKN